MGVWDIQIFNMDILKYLYVGILRNCSIWIMRYCYFGVLRYWGMEVWGFLDIWIEQLWDSYDLVWEVGIQWNNFILFSHLQFIQPLRRHLNLLHCEIVFVWPAFYLLGMISGQILRKTHARCFSISYCSVSFWYLLS